MERVLRTLDLDGHTADVVEMVDESDAWLLLAVGDAVINADVPLSTEPTMTRSEPRCGSGRNAPDPRACHGPSEPKDRRAVRSQVGAGRVSPIERWAWRAIVLNTGLGLVHACPSGSLAVAAARRTTAPIWWLRRSARQP